MPSLFAIPNTMLSRVCGLKCVKITKILNQLFTIARSLLSATFGPQKHVSFPYNINQQDALFSTNLFQ